MDDLDALIGKEAARQGAEDGNIAPVVESSTTEAPIAEKPAEQANDKPAVVIPPIVEEKPAVQNINNDKPPVNGDTNAAFIENLERLSGGTIKNTEDLSAAIAKLGEYDILSARVKELDAKASTKVFADEYEQRRNELKMSGASKDQLKSFEKINDLGDLSEMDDLEARVQKLILVDGYEAKAARLKVSKEFDLDNTFDEDLEVMKEDLRLTSKADRKALEAFKTEVSTPLGDTKILDAAGKATLEKSLEPVLNDFTQKYNSLTTFSLKNKNDDTVVPYELKLNADDKAQFTTSIKGFMLDNNLPLTQDNYNMAVANARREFLETKQDEIVQNVWTLAEAHFTKLFSDKYANSGGLPKGDLKPGEQATDDAKALKAFKGELLGA